MLAKVLKREEAAIASLFPIPEIGDGTPRHQSLSDVVLPAIDPYQEYASFHDEVIIGSAADEILQAARAQAERVVAEAEEKSAALTQAAADKAAHETSESIEIEVAERVADLRNELARTVAQIGKLTESVKNCIETHVVDLALQIAKKVVNREVTIDREVALTLVKVSLAKIHSPSRATVRLNPDDHAFVMAQVGNLDFRGSIELIEDRAISLGGCLITTDTGDIDARIESQFDEIAHGLLH